MKIRTDFVTNSSSSSYCVSLRVYPVKKKKSISLNLWPAGEDGSEDVWVGMRSDLHKFIEQVKACSSVDELKSLLVNLLDFSERLKDIDINNSDPNEVILQALAEFCEDADEDDYGVGYALQISEAFSKFQEEFGKITSLSDIKSITVTEYFTGWGEYAIDGVEDFMSKAIPEDLDWDDEDTVKEALKDGFSKGEIDSLIDQVQNSSIGMFNASIDTTIEMATGNVTKKYEFEDMT